MRNTIALLAPATIFLFTLTCSLFASDPGFAIVASSGCGSIIDPTLAMPVEPSFEPPALAPQSAAVDCSGLCGAEWNGTHWIITIGCTEKSCACNVPGTTSSVSLAAGTDKEFTCFERNANATAERFFLDLCGEGTGIHHLCFDKSNMEMFTGFFVKVRDDNNNVWQIEAKWAPDDYKKIPENDGELDGADQASVVLRCDSDKLGDMAQTVTFKKGDVVKYQFGAWKLEVTYVGK